jgi:hypothetical protein
MGDLESVKRLVAEGADVNETILPPSYTPFLWAASQGRIPIMHWLLTEGGSSLAEHTTSGAHALLLATCNGQWPAVQWLLEEQGASIIERDNLGATVWSKLWGHCGGRNAAELSSLLKVMVMLDDTPADVIINLLPQHAAICKNGRRLRAQLPSYLEQQRATVVTHCPLPGVLRSVVAAYAATTPKDMWADREDEGDGEDAPPFRRYLRFR